MRTRPKITLNQWDHSGAVFRAQLLGLWIALGLLPGSLVAQPVVSGAVSGVYATVTDPVLISFAPDGTLYCGRDAGGSGGGGADAVKIHRVGPGGSPVTEFGDTAISDPDAVIVDVAGTVSGLPGSVLVGGVHSVANQGKLSRIAPDGTVTTLFGPSTAFENPTAFTFDESGRLLFTEFNDGSVQETTGATPSVLFPLTQANRIVTDQLDRIVVSTTGGTELRLYSSSGTLLDPSFTTVKSASPLTRGPGGDWGTDIYAVAGNGDLLRLDTNGTATVVGSGFANIMDFKFGPDGAFYASDFNADRIYRFGPPVIPGATTTVYSTVTDPVRLSFDGQGTLYVGRDNSGSGGGASDAVRFHRVSSGGSIVTEYPNTPISDPDSVYFDADGHFSGTPGAVMAGGLEAVGQNGKIVKVVTDGSIVTLFGPTAFAFNPNLFVYDPVHDRLLFSDDLGGKVWVMTNTVPVPLFNLASAFPLAVDSLGRILAAGNNSTLNLYDANGILLTNNFATIQVNSPMATGPGGSWGTGVYAVDGLGNLTSIATNGTVTRVGSNFANLTGFAFGPDGALYASQFNNDLIWRITAPQATPQLSLVRGASLQATVSWTPETGTNWVLQESLSLSPTQWMNAPSGTNNPVVVPATAPTKFYRLNKP